MEWFTSTQMSFSYSTNVRGSFDPYKTPQQSMLNSRILTPLMWEWFNFLEVQVRWKSQDVASESSENWINLNLTFLRSWFRKKKNVPLWKVFVSINLLKLTQEPWRNQGKVASLSAHLLEILPGVHFMQTESLADSASDSEIPRAPRQR